MLILLAHSAKIITLAQLYRWLIFNPQTKKLQHTNEKLTPLKKKKNSMRGTFNS